MQRGEINFNLVDGVSASSSTFPNLSPRPPPFLFYTSVLSLFLSFSRIPNSELLTLVFHSKIEGRRPTYFLLISPLAPFTRTIRNVTKRNLLFPSVFQFPPQCLSVHWSSICPPILYFPFRVFFSFSFARRASLSLYVPVQSLQTRHNFVADRSELLQII